MAFYMVNVVFFLMTLVAYFTTRLGSIKLDHIISGILFFAFLCMIAFRPSTVRDTIPYINLFNSMESYQFTFGLGRHVGVAGGMELGFANLCKLTSLISSSYQVFFFVVALLTVGVGVLATMLISSKMNNTLSLFQQRILPAFILFVSYYGFMYTGIVLRAGLAISFCLLAYAMIFRKRYVFALFAFLIAFSFHNSALIFLVIIVAYVVLPVGDIKTYRVIALSITGLYILRFFDLFMSLVIKAAQLIASQFSFVRIFESYLRHGFGASSFLKTILFFMFEFIFLTFCLDEKISKKQKKNLNVIMVVSITAGLFGSLPLVYRVIDVLFIIIIPSLYYALISMSPEETFYFGKELALKKLPICIVGVGFVSIANFLLFSRWSGYLELAKEQLLG